MGGFGDFFGDVFSGIKSVGEGVWNGALKPVYEGVIKPVGGKVWGLASGALNRVDRLQGLGDKVIDGAGNAAEGIGNLLNSPILLTLIAGVLAIVILPKLIA